MKSLQFFSLLFLVGNEAAAFPTTTESDSPLVALGEEASAIEPLVNLPHVPLGNRDLHASHLATIKARASEATGLDVDLDAAVPMDAYTPFVSKAVGGHDSIPGHPVPSELLQLLVRQGSTSGGAKEKRGTFNAEAQLIDVTGEHIFIAPNFTQGDKRGPCPGMNSLANHGYISRDGIATVAESITAVNNVYGMGIDIATFLTTYSLVLSGNALSINPSYSIGDESAEAQNILDNLGGLLGKPMGLDATHNTFEVDGSSTRGDLYDPNGNNHDVNMTYFMELYNLQKDAEDPNYTLDVMIDNALNRFDQAVAYNPYFYYGPFSGMVLRNGATFFAARLMANCSEEYPDGILGKEILKSFFGVTGPEENMTYSPGHERIPDNWYRRSDDYDVPGVGLDLVNMATKNPRVLGIGGNTNGVNTYSGINPSDIIGSGLNTTDLLEGNNLLCFAFQTLKLGSPNSLSTLYSTVAKPLEILLGVIDSTVLSLDCPAFGDLTYGGTDLFDYMNQTYPGAAKSGNAL